MTPPTVQDLADYLRLDPADQAAEEGTLVRILAAAKATLQSLISVPIEETEIEYVDQSQSGVAQAPITVLMFPYRPIGASVAVTDSQGIVVDPTTYNVSTQQGFVRGLNGVTFPSGPYTLVGTYGLELFRNYEVMIEPMLNQAIIDIAADMFQFRTVRATAENAGDTRVSWEASADVIGRVKSALAILKLPVLAV